MRLTYRSALGDYGCAQTFKDDWEEKYAFRNKLGKFEDAYEWNPVEKAGYPKEDGTYYVTVLDPVGGHGEERFVLCDEFNSNSGKFSLEKVDYKVIAWMSILVPEPYKGVNQ